MINKLESSIFNKTIEKKLEPKRVISQLKKMENNRFYKKKI